MSAVTCSSGHHDELYELLIAGFHALDNGAAESVSTTDDFSLMLPHTIIAGAAYDDFLQSRANADYVTRHCVSNFRVSNLRLIEDHTTTATVAYVVTAYRLYTGDTTASATVADFVDEWVRADQGWRLRSRSISSPWPVRA
ncbi:nuclear transport factor 2 family protein [Mycolicibacterium hodleri]|uniref:SnoaL-like domain-containing protein n=1 Tax=Mycolicibacterium hodleri TaxID=49897 RepID=A0A502EK65_9MYCO|nr:nuclear transport factor 2 family protein [Mycolicibacterium hodleri]TPG36721.1 hypothetical protein EAH80_01930 [Mycolicibacterium hodleri]